MSGGLLVFEGADGVGKSTLAEEVHNYLVGENHRSYHTAFPGNEAGTLGKLIYDIHHNPEEYKLRELDQTSKQVLHVAAHIDEINQRILPVLKQGGYVVLDRFWWSTWVYGVIYDVPKKPLEAMIELELSVWGDNLPTNLFLITAPIPFRQETDEVTWKALNATYEVLVAREDGKYPIDIIENTDSFEVLLDKVIKKVNI